MQRPRQPSAVSGISRIARACLVFAVLAAGIALSPSAASAGGASTTVRGCTLTVNAVQSAANSSRAIGSAFASGSDPDCNGTRVKLWYKRNGRTYRTSYRYDYGSSGGYYAERSRSNATAVKALGGMRAGGASYWTGLVAWA